MNDGKSYIFNRRLDLLAIFSRDSENARSFVIAKNWFGTCPLTPFFILEFNERLNKVTNFHTSFRYRLGSQD